MYRGGNWNNTSNAGVFYANGNNPRSNYNTNIGFRPAFVRFSDGCTSEDLNRASKQLAKVAKAIGATNIIEAAENFARALREAAEEVDG